MAAVSSRRKQSKPRRMSGGKLREMRGKCGVFNEVKDKKMKQGDDDRPWNLEIFCENNKVEY